MPWKVSSPMEEKVKFVLKLKDGERMSDLCKVFGISRNTGYKYLNRYNQEGIQGLKELSRRPHSSPLKMTIYIEEEIIKLRQEHPTWGARKIKARLEKIFPNLVVPSASVIHECLNRHGLIENKSSKKHQAGRLNLIPTEQPSELWCVDFKGQFQLQNKSICYPLTVTDFASRYIIECFGLPDVKSKPVITIFEKLFKENGMPIYIRTDNGSPFSAPHGLLGLTSLSAWWVSLGIKLQRIQPGKPQENGRHERMHKTLKEEATRPSEFNMEEQQKRFEKYKIEYNSIRPHEALMMKTPIELYTKSKIEYNPKILKYPLHDFSKTINSKGYFDFLNNCIYISEALKGYDIGIVEETEDIWRITFSYLDLGFYDAKENIFTPNRQIN